VIARAAAAASLVPVLALALAATGCTPVAPGNALVVLNAGSRGIDSIVVEPDPPGAHAITARHGYLAPRDSARIGLPGGQGDADVRVWRDGRVVADHVAYFGGRSEFEVRVGDSAEAGRYRRTR
jgi:hypothetical protein